MSKLIKIYRQFYDPFEANIIVNKLRGNGLKCFLTNENATNLLWHLNIAQGGVNLMLNEKDFPLADKILGIDDPLSIEELDESNVRCPKCSSTNVRLGSITNKINWWQFLSLFYMAIPAPISRKSYHCFNCGENFDLKKDRSK